MSTDLENAIEQLEADGNIEGAQAVRALVPRARYTITTRRGDTVLRTRTASNMDAVWVDILINGFEYRTWVGGAVALLNQLTDEGGQIDMGHGIVIDVTTEEGDHA